MESLRNQEGLSIARFCAYVDLPRSTYYYRRSRGSTEQAHGQSETRLDPGLRERSRELALKYPMYGYRKVWALLGDDRHRVSMTTVYRWLKEEGLLLSPVTSSKPGAGRGRPGASICRFPSLPMNCGRWILPGWMWGNTGCIM